MSLKVRRIKIGRFGFNVTERFPAKRLQSIAAKIGIKVRIFRIYRLHY